MAQHFPHVALVIEGGGTRNSYTAAVIDKFLAEGFSFGWVGGVSAGSSLTGGMLSGSRKSVKEAFVDVPAAREAGGWGSFLRGRGYFDAEYIYEKSTVAGERFAIDYDAISTNPTPFRIGAVRADTGEMVYWGKQDIHSLADFTLRVRASSTMPVFMPMPLIDGIRYVDGALGPTGGIPIDAARKDGFTTFFVLLSRPRDYTKPAVTRPAALRRLFRNYPAVADAMIARPGRYNRTREELLRLETEGKAYLFFPTHLSVHNRERNLAKLEASFAAGQAQVERDWPAISRFLQQTNSSLPG
ncbi:patatin-like phospholipase family protein [Corynebacterium sp. H130]|uniref:patatin-like phospholipase family protein n=1 Tax=Corynebacterium sp. H130 TaxID=3133444 RepID=UPI0030993A37